MPNLKSHEQASILGNFVPPGVIMPFAGATAPAGWLLCDGSSQLRADYPSLFTAIGTSWGTVDGTHFNLPDFRGRFLRGVDGGIARDPDRATRTASNTGGNTGDNVGSVQAEATKPNGLGASTNSTGSHTHSLTGGPYVNVLGSGETSRTYLGGGSSTQYSQIQNAGDHSHSVSFSGDNETRPLNANVNYIIKY